MPQGSDRRTREAIQRASVLLQRGDIGEARAALSSILDERPDDGDALSLLGIALARQQDFVAAAQTLSRAVELEPQHAGARLNYGNVLRKLGRWTEAVEQYRQAVALRSDAQLALRHLAMTLLDLQRFDEAIDAFNRAARLRPDDAEIYLGRARAARGVGNNAAALYDLDNVLKIDVGNVDALTLRAAVKRSMSRRDEALADCDRALQIDPGNWSLHNNRGVLLDELGRPEEALPCFERSLELNPNNPDAFQNMGTALVALKRGEEAIAKYDASLKAHPRNVEVLNAKGAVLIAMRRFEDALASFDQAIAAEPESPVSNFHRAFALLALGRFREGFEAYEWRRRGERPFVALPRFAQPEIAAGEDPKGKTLLLYCEQGMGDIIQFARFARLYAERGAKVVVAAYPALVRVLSTLGENIDVVPPQGPVPGFDSTCPLLSAPHKLGVTLETVPGQVPYLSAPAERIAEWRERLAAIPQGLRVGLAWSGNAQYANDWTRSIPFASLRAIMDVPGTAFVNVQRDLRPSDEQAFADAGIVDFRELLTDFGETAALMSKLDIVVSVDTSLAHLAGALGRPVWVLLSAVSDWRWLEHRDDSPWYPTARLFRQQTIGDWGAVLDEVKAALIELALRKRSDQ